MAIYHFTAKIVSRAKGQSAVAKAAYNARERLEDERTGDAPDYRRKSGLLFSGIFAPKDAPEWAQDREELWNHVEAIEKRRDSQLAREIEIALPHELSDEQRRWLVTDFVRENFVRKEKGMVADVAIHAPNRDGDERNFHAHILLTTRAIGLDGFAREKEVAWNGRALLQEWREDFAVKGARMLERAGFGVEAERFRWGYLTQEDQYRKAIDRGDFEFAQAKSRSPTEHVGPNIAELEARGQLSEVQERRARDADRQYGRLGELAALRVEIAEIEREKLTLVEALHREWTEPSPVAEAIDNIRCAYEQSDGAAAFREALAERGFWLARATDEDAAAAHFEHGRAETYGRYSPLLDVGDVVAIDTLGRVFTLGRNATGDTREEVSAFLAPLAEAALPGVEETRAEFRAPLCEYVDIDCDAGRKAREVPEKSPALGGAVRKLAGEILAVAEDAAESAIDMLGDAVAPTNPTRELLIGQAADRAAQSERQAADWKRYLADEDYRRQTIQREQRERAQHVQDEYHRRSRDRDR